MKTNYVNTLTRSYFNTLLFLFISLSCYAQTDSVQYFDGYDRRAPESVASYYRKMSKADTGNVYLGVEYWTSGHLKVMGHSLDPDFLYKIGKFVFYYPNGNKSGEGEYYSDYNQHVFGFKNRKWATYYLNGKPKEEWIYKISEDITYSDGFLMSYWDNKGVQLVTKGNGRYEYTEKVNTRDSAQHILFSKAVHNGLFDSVWHGYYANGKEYMEEVYRSGKLVKGKSFDGAGTAYSYDSIQTPPDFQGGEAELNRFIKLNVQPPANMASDILKEVTVRIFIGRNGFVGNVNILKGVNQPMNMEAMRVAKALPRFIPATVRGQPVDSYYVFPVSFNVQ